MSALISPDGSYRYWLRRSWGVADPERWSNRKAIATFVMLNPSTADAETNDPTINRCCAYAERWGLGGLLVVNLYAFRATSPADLIKAVDPVGPDNDMWLCRALAAAAWAGTPVVAGWGAMAQPSRVRRLMTLPGGDRLWALKINKDGSPGHPLYLRGDCQLVPFGREDS